MIAIANSPHTSEPSRLAAMQATQEAKAKAKSDRASKGKAPKPSKPSSSSASVRRGDNMGEVIIDGVVFAFDETGTKLVKKASRPADDEEETQATAGSAPGMSALTSATTPPSPSKAPLRTSINGQSFVRTKRGNLISAQLVEERRTQKENAIRMKKLARMGRQIGENEKTRYVLLCRQPALVNWSKALTADSSRLHSQICKSQRGQRFEGIWSHRWTQRLVQLFYKDRLV